MKPTRRELFFGCAAAALAQRHKLIVGIDSYSIRDFRWKAPQLLDYAAAMKVGALQISEGSFESTEAAYLGKIKEQAARLGILVEPGFGCISPKSKGWNPKRTDQPVAYLREAIRVAKTLGSPCVRVFVGGAADRAAGADAIAAIVEDSVKSLRAVRQEALDARVKIAVENHGDLQARETAALIEAAGKEHVACNFDSGNPCNLLEDPLYALETLAPYIVTSHIRDSVVFEHARGAAVQWVALGEGVIDFQKFAKRYKELCPSAPFHMEVITGRAPQVLPYLEPEFMKRFPRMTAGELARFVAIAKAGRPLMSGMVVAGEGKQPAEYVAALKEQQRVDLERSLAYAARLAD